MSNLSSKKLQLAMKEHERKLRDFEASDLESVLTTFEGRRMYYRLVFELCNLESSGWNPALKDGVVAGMHMAHMEGRRDVGRVLLQEAQTHCPDLWRKLLNEALTEADTVAAEREHINKTAKGINDE